MPSWSKGAAHLNFTYEVSKSEEGAPRNAPWCWPSWQTLTGHARAPWEPVPPGEQHPFAWTPEQVAKAAEYVKEFMRLDKPAARQKFSKHARDRFRDGRDLVNLTLSSAFTTWNIPTVIRDALRHAQKDPYTVAAAHGARKVSHTRDPILITNTFQLPPIAEENIANARVELAHTCFGECVEGVSEASRPIPQHHGQVTG